jgi:hypothetical protein
VCCKEFPEDTEQKDILYTLKTGSSTKTVYELIGLFWYRSTSRYVITVNPQFSCSLCTTHADYSVIPKMKAILKYGGSVLKMLSLGYCQWYTMKYDCAVLVEFEVMQVHNQKSKL